MRLWGRNSISVPSVDVPGMYREQRASRRAAGCGAEYARETRKWGRFSDKQLKDLIQHRYLQHNTMFRIAATRIRKRKAQLGHPRGRPVADDQRRRLGLLNERNPQTKDCPSQFAKQAE